MKVEIRGMVAEIPNDAIYGGIVDIEFGSDYQIQIAETKNGWKVTNAVDGWGINCKETFINERVNIIP